MTENNNDQQSSRTDSNMTADVTPTPEAPLHSSDTLTFGEWLQKNRTLRRISLEEIAAVTKVHIMQLKALEENDVNKLPAPAFVRGFLVSYARHLEIDENEVLDRYKNSFGGSLTPIADLLTPTQNRSVRSASAPKVSVVSSPHLKQAPSAREVEGAKVSPFSFKNISIVIGTIGIVTLIAVLVSLGKNEKTKEAAARETVATAPSNSDNLSNSSPAPVETTASSDQTNQQKKDPSPNTSASTQSKAENNNGLEPKATNPVATAAILAEKTKSSATSPAKTAEKPSPQKTTTVAKKYQLEMRAIEPNYVHLRVDDDAPRGITLKAAQSQSINVNKKAVLTISDAGNLELRWNGVWYSSLGYRGDLKVITLPDQVSSLTPKAPKIPAKPKQESSSAEDTLLLNESLN